MSQATPHPALARGLTPPSSFPPPHTHNTHYTAGSFWLKVVYEEGKVMQEISVPPRQREIPSCVALAEV